MKLTTVSKEYNLGNTVLNKYKVRPSHGTEL